MNSQTKLLAISVCILSVAVLNQFCSAKAVLSTSPTTTVPDSSGTTSDVTVSLETSVTSEETATTEEETVTESTTGQTALTEKKMADPEPSTISETPKSVVPIPRPDKPAVKSPTLSPVPITKKSNDKTPEVADGTTDDGTTEATITTLPNSELTTTTTKPPSTTKLKTSLTTMAKLPTTTTVTTTKATTQQPTPTTLKKETQAPVVIPTTLKKETQAPVVVPTTHPRVVTLPPSPVVPKTQPPPARSTLTPSTQKPEPVKTEEPHQEDHDDSGDHHTHSLLTSNPETNKNDTDNSWLEKFSHNSLISKLMFPVILGVVAAFVIVCFAYGVRAYRKNKSRGRRKMMSNGQDHDMSSNFDRVKLLADSSEDEF